MCNTVNAKYLRIFACKKFLFASSPKTNTPELISAEQIRHHFRNKFVSILTHLLLNIILKKNLQYIINNKNFNSS